MSRNHRRKHRHAPETTRTGQYRPLDYGATTRHGEHYQGRRLTPLPCYRPARR